MEHDASVSAAARDELIRQIGRVRPDTEAFAELRPKEAPGLERARDFHRIAAPAERQNFGRWLLRQDRRDDCVGALARSAAADRAFPRDGSVEDVRVRPRALGADDDIFAALDIAELDWLSL